MHTRPASRRSCSKDDCAPGDQGLRRRAQLLVIALICGVALSLPGATPTLSAPLPLSEVSAVVGTGTPESCTHTALHHALQTTVPDSAVLRVSFDCGHAPHTIDILTPADDGTTTEVIGRDTIVDGGNLITLDGGLHEPDINHHVQIFRVCDAVHTYTGVHLTVKNITLTHGRAHPDTAGGAIANYGCILKVIHSTLSNNVAYYEGGAIANFFGGPLAVEKSMFVSNQSQHSEGGAISTVLGGQLTISGSQFLNNSANGATGGAIYVEADGLTIDRSSFSGNMSVQSGGAISMGGTTTAPLRITRTSFSNNVARQSGAALAIHNGNAPITLSRDTFSNNTVPTNEASAGSGGAISSSGALTVEHGLFTGNSAFGSGGALITNGGVVLVSDTTFSNNRAANGFGGALANVFGRVTIARSRFIANNAGAGGGAVFNRGLLDLSDSTFSDNAATVSNTSTSVGSGGAILTGGSPGPSGIPRALSVARSTFLRNSASGGVESNGGAIANSTTGIVTATNSTFAYNLALGGGGAINNAVGGGSVLVINSTLSENSAGQGGGVNGAVTIQNAILANNVAGDNCGAAVTASGPNLEFPGASCEASLQADPRLGSLGGHGGATANFSLRSDSPAIDAGDNALCAASPVNNVDQRGASRPAGPACDLGSYERGSHPTAAALTDAGCAAGLLGDERKQGDEQQEVAPDPAACEPGVDEDTP